MAPKRSEKLEIVNGPSKFDLMLALFDREGGSKIKLSIQEGEGSNSLEFELHAVGRHGFSKEDWHIKVTNERHIYEGRYSTQTRKGHIEYK